MNAAIVARTDHVLHCECSRLLKRAHDVRLAIAVTLPSPISTRARSRPTSRRAATVVSDAERFGPASDISTILICYDGTPGACQAVEHAGRLLPGCRALVLNVWSSP